ncbi:MAG: helix-turn-helix domain-containing protein [Thermotogae bacterium]|nr:helix-turn-helix domain-containing protein [Thermotogota bacterium]
MEIWDEIGEKLIDLFNGDVICTDMEGVPKFSTMGLSADLSQAVSVAIKTGVRVGLVHDQKHVLVIPFNFTNFKGCVLLVGYEFSEETLAIFVQNVLEEFAKTTEGYAEESIPSEIISAFKGVSKPILCAAISQIGNIQLRGEMAKIGGRFVKHMESGEDFFIFDGKIEKVPEGCKAGISEHLPYRIAYHQSVTALHYGSDPSGLSSYSKLSPVFLIQDIIENKGMKKVLIEKLEKYPELLQTLKIFFENDVSPVKTSKVMKIHRNTILNRLNKIREITYLDPKVFKDSVILYLTLMNSEEKVLE